MSTQHPRAPRALVALVAATALVIAACSDANQVADLEPVAPAASAPVIEPEGTEPEGTEPEGTEADAITVATTPSTSSGPVTTPAPSGSGDDELTGPQFSDALGTRVDTAPGVRTRGDTRRLLDAGLWVHLAWEPDPEDPSVFTVQPDDIPILEAYANAVTTYYRAATTTLTTEDPDFAKYIIDANAMFGQSFREARDGGFVLDLGAGVVLRPYVVDRSVDEAVVYDCYLQDELYVSRSSERAEGALLQRGQVVTLGNAEGLWLVKTAAELGEACL